jgi:hypothetical protein
MLLPTGAFVGGKPVGALVGDCIGGTVLLADPIPAFLEAPIDAPTPVGGDCGFRGQLSSVQESVCFAAVLFRSGEFEPIRWDCEKSELGAVLGLEGLLPGRPIAAPLLLLLAAASQEDARSLVVDAERVEGEEDDCCGQFGAMFGFDCPPR